MDWLLRITLAGALASCGGTPEVSNDASKVAIDSGPDFSQRDQVFAAYGVIETIAGTGDIEDKGENGWDPSFEGGDALDAELSRPHIAQADADGQIYVADKDAHSIRVVHLDGTITTFAGTNQAGDLGNQPVAAASAQLSAPNGLWVGQDAVYVLDLGNDKVRRVRGGVLETLFTIGGAATGRGLWVADDESVAYVAAGASLKTWTPNGGVRVLASGFVSLGNLVVTDDGSLLVCDRGAHRVYRVNPATGEKQAIAGSGSRTGGGDGKLAVDTGLDEVRGVWTHPQGGYFLATHKGGQVWYVDDGGYIHLFVNGDANDSHTGNGVPFNDPSVRISEPRAVTLDSVGNILITEHDAGYIRRVLVK